MIAYNTFNKILHLSRSEYLLQSIHNGQQNFLYELSTAMLIFSKCVYLINLAKGKFDPNETIIMYDLSSSNLLSLVYNLFLLTGTLVKPCTYPLRCKQENFFCKFNKVIITILLTFVGFGELLVQKVLHACCSHLSLV